MPRANGMDDLLLEGYMPHGPQQLEHKLQQSAPNTINISKAVSSKIMMNTNDLFDNVLNLEEDDQQEPRLNKIINQSSIRTQRMKNDEEGEEAAGTKPVIKAILKTKKMNSIRFDQIAAQCLGQAETKRGRGQKEEMVERLPLQSEDSCSSDFNPLMSPASKSGKFSHDFDEHVQNKCQNHYINSMSSTPSMTASMAAACAKLPQNGEELDDSHALKKDGHPNKKRQRKAYTKRNKKM